MAEVADSDVNHRLFLTSEGFDSKALFKGFESQKLRLKMRKLNWIVNTSKLNTSGVVTKLSCNPSDGGSHQLSTLVTYLPHPGGKPGPGVHDNLGLPGGVPAPP